MTSVVLAAMYRAGMRPEARYGPGACLKDGESIRRVMAERWCRWRAARVLQHAWAHCRFRPGGSGMHAACGEWEAMCN